MQGEIYLSLERMIKATSTSRAGLSLENRCGLVLVEHFRENTFQSIAECVRACFLVERRPVCDGDSCVEFLQSGFVDRQFCSTLSDYEKSQNKIKLSETGVCLLHEQKMCTSYELGAEKKIVSSNVLIKA